MVRCLWHVQPWVTASKEVRFIRRWTHCGIRMTMLEQSDGIDARRPDLSEFIPFVVGAFDVQPRRLWLET
jgi:hypothetical protein